MLLTAMYLAPDTETVAPWDACTGIGLRLIANAGFVLLIVAGVLALFERRRSRRPAGPAR